MAAQIKGQKGKILISNVSFVLIIGFLICLAMIAVFATTVNDIESRRLTGLMRECKNECLSERKEANSICPATFVVEMSECTANNKACLQDAKIKKEECIDSCVILNLSTDRREANIQKQWVRDCKAECKGNYSITVRGCRETFNGCRSNATDEKKECNKDVRINFTSCISWCELNISQYHNNTQNTSINTTVDTNFTDTNQTQVNQTDFNQTEGNITGNVTGNQTGTNHSFENETIG